VTGIDTRSTSTEEVVLGGGPFVQVMKEATVTVTDIDARIVQVLKKYC